MIVVNKELGSLLKSCLELYLGDNVDIITGRKSSLIYHTKIPKDYVEKFLKLGTSSDIKIEKYYNYLVLRKGRFTIYLDMGLEKLLVEMVKTPVLLEASEIDYDRNIINSIKGKIGYGIPILLSKLQKRVPVAIYDEKTSNLTIYYQNVKIEIKGIKQRASISIKHENKTLDNVIIEIYGKILGNWEKITEFINEYKIMYNTIVRKYSKVMGKDVAKRIAGAGLESLKKTIKSKISNIIGYHVERIGYKKDETIGTEILKKFIGIKLEE